MIQVGTIFNTVFNHTHLKQPCKVIEVGEIKKLVKYQCLCHPDCRDVRWADFYFIGMRLGSKHCDDCWDFCNQQCQIKIIENTKVKM